MDFPFSPSESVIQISLNREINDILPILKPPLGPGNSLFRTIPIAYQGCLSHYWTYFLHCLLSSHGSLIGNADDSFPRGLLILLWTFNFYRSMRVDGVLTLVKIHGLSKVDCCFTYFGISLYFHIFFIPKD